MMVELSNFARSARQPGRTWVTTNFAESCKHLSVQIVILMLALVGAIESNATDDGSCTGL